MSLALLPPVGQRVRLGASEQPKLPEVGGVSPLLLGSGTQALALSLMVAAARSEEARPAVLLPAYGCPDLVAAANYAQLDAILVDCEPDFHGFDLAALEAALEPRVVAVVAVNLLGVRERLGAIRGLLATHQSRAVLIEDNAQYWPEDLPADAMAGDIMLTSFGRGKPVNLLGGAALWFSPELAEAFSGVAIGDGPDRSAGFAWKARVFNGLLNPVLYRLVSSLPFLHIGETVYHPLDGISALGEDRAGLLNRNLAVRCATSRKPQQAIAAMLAGQERVVDLVATAPEGAGRLLRYPVLCADAAQRDAWEARFVKAGIGATGLYRRPLFEIDGVAQRAHLRAGDAGARQFAEKLLTLPVHEGVKGRHLKVMEQVFSRL